MMSWFLVTCAFLTGPVPNPTQAGDPTARDLIALAPVLDSSDKRCQSLDLCVYMGSENGPGPKLKLRVLYQAPNRFSMLISDATDGTPLVLCSGGKMLVYDPVGPTVLYSECGSFNLETISTDTHFKFNYAFTLNRHARPRIFVDFPSILARFSGEDADKGGMALTDKVEKRDSGKFTLSRTQDRLGLIMDFDIEKKCPYTKATIIWDDASVLCFDHISLDGTPRDDPFEFPSKEQLSLWLPIKEVKEGDKANLDIVAKIARAQIVRAHLNRTGPLGVDEVPGLPGVDWNKVRNNDNKYSEILRKLVPQSLKTH